MKPASSPLGLPSLDLPRPGSRRRTRSITPRSLADLVMVGLARMLIRVFFRHVEVEHGERICSGRPTVLVANHRNGLVDGLLLIAALGRYPRFLGKSTLFRIPLLWPFLNLAGVIPVYRTQDGVSTVRNRGTFARSDRLLARGGMVAIFPEGISHDEPALQPLRTGAARIALGAADHGIADVETVAVALVYDEKQRFRSRALVRVGVPEAVGRRMAGFRADDHQAVRRLTDELAARLREVGPAEVSLRRHQQVAAVEKALERAEHSEDGDALIGSLHVAHDRYVRDLTLLGLNDAQVAAGYGSSRLRWTFLWALANVVAAAPFAAVGLIVHGLPYGVVKRLSRIPDNEGMRATVKLLGNFFLFTAVYVTIGVLVGQAYGTVAGVLAALSAPCCGYLAVRTIERMHGIGGAVAGFRLARHRGPLLASVLANRAVVVDAAQAIIENE